MQVLAFSFLLACIAIGCGKKEEKSPAASAPGEAAAAVSTPDQTAPAPAANPSPNPVGAADARTAMADTDAALKARDYEKAVASALAIQTQQTDRLYAEATATTDRVQEGNLMLVKARERASDTRKWILVFLILASFILFFLNLYDLD